VKKLRDLIERFFIRRNKNTENAIELNLVQEKVLLFHAEDRFINTLDLTHDYGNELRK